MTSAPALQKLAFGFGIAFAVCYPVALFRDLALFTVYPSLGIVLPGAHHSRDVADPALGFVAPEMLWYGWTAAAAAGALVVGVVVSLLPDRFTRLLWSTLLWAVPVLAMIACVYFEIPWFRR
jgi:hypothetical protein